MCSDDVSPFTYNDIIIVVISTFKPLLYTDDNTRKTFDELYLWWREGNERYNKTLRLNYSTKYENKYFKNEFSRQDKGQRDKIAMYTS